MFLTSRAKPMTTVRIYFATRSATKKPSLHPNSPGKLPSPGCFRLRPRLLGASWHRHELCAAAARPRTASEPTGTAEFMAARTLKNVGKRKDAETFSLFLFILFCFSDCLCFFFVYWFRFLFDHLKYHRKRIPKVP